MGMRYHYQTNLFGNKTIVGMSFIVRAGLWAKYFLNEEGNRSRTAYFQRGILPKLLLESIMSLWQQREGAARLMVWLLFKTQTHQEALPVKTLLEVAYGITAVEQAKSDRVKRKKIVNDWDEVLMSLKERGWRLRFDETYPVEIQPLGFSRTTEKRPRGFFELLLGAYLWIEPEESVANEALLLQEGTTQVSDSQPVPVSNKLTPEWIKELPQRKGWSQRDLAKAANLSQTLICQLEKGSRSITEESRSQLSVAFGIGC